MLEEEKKSPAEKPLIISNPFGLNELLELASLPWLSGEEIRKSNGLLTIAKRKPILTGMSFYLPDGVKITFSRFSDVTIEGWETHFPEDSDRKAFSDFAEELKIATDRQALPRDLFYKTALAAGTVISYLSQTSQESSAKAKELAKLFIRQQAAMQQIIDPLRKDLPHEIRQKCFLFGVWCCLNQQITTSDIHRQK